MLMGIQAAYAIGFVSPEYKMVEHATCIEDS